MSPHLLFTLAFVLTLAGQHEAMVREFGENKLYYSEQLLMAIDQAEKLCSSLGGLIPSIHSQLELEQLSKAGVEGPSFLGARATDNSGKQLSPNETYQWQDGSPFDFYQWQPSCTSDCCIVLYSQQGLIDGPCDWHSAICLIPDTSSKTRQESNIREDTMLELMKNLTSDQGQTLNFVRNSTLMQLEQAKLLTDLESKIVQSNDSYKSNSPESNQSNSEGHQIPSSFVINICFFLLNLMFLTFTVTCVLRNFVRHISSN